MSLTATPGLNGGGGAFGSGAGILGGRLLGNQFGIVAIGVDAGASNLLRRIGALSRTTGEQVSAAAGGLQVFGGALRASTIILATTIAAVGTAVVVVDEFNETIAKTAGILDEDVDTVMESVGRRAIELSKQFGFSATEIADAGRQLAQAGLSLEEVEIALESVTAFSTVVGGDFKQSVNLAVRVMNGFKLEAEDLNDVLNSLTFIINTSPVVISDLEAAFKQLTPVTAQLGVSLESTAAAIAAVSRAGLAGSTGGTSLASGLIQLLSPAENIQNEFGNLVGAFKETLQTTGDLSIALDAFLREAGSNINEFSATIDDLRNNEGLEAFSDLSDGALEELGTRFEIINILLDILGTRSAKGFLDFAANAEQARLDTLALQLGLNDFRDSAEISLQNINDQLKIFRNNLAAPFLEGDFAETLTKGLEELNQGQLGEELTESLAGFAEQGLEQLLNSLPKLIELLGTLGDAISSIGGVLDFAIGTLNTVTGALSLFDDAGLKLVLTYVLVNKIFGQFIGGIGNVTNSLGGLITAKGKDVIQTQKQVSAYNVLEANITKANTQSILQSNAAAKRAVGIEKEIALRAVEINQNNQWIGQKQHEIAELQAEAFARGKANVSKNKGFLIGNKLYELEKLHSRQNSLIIAQGSAKNQLKREEKVIQEAINGTVLRATILNAAENQIRKTTIADVTKIIGLKAKNLVIQQGLNIALFAGIGAIFQYSQGNKALGGILTATAAALVAYRTYLFLANGAVQALAASNLALKIIMNPFVGAGILAAVTVGLIAFSAKMRSAAEDTSNLNAELSGLDRTMKNLFPDSAELVDGANSIVELDRIENEDGDIERTVQINFEVDETSTAVALDQLQQLRDAGVDVSVQSGDLVEGSFEDRIAAFEKLIDEIEASGVEINDDALLENIFGNNADLVRSIIEGDLQDVEFSARIISVEIEDKEQIQSEIDEILRTSVFGLGLIDTGPSGGAEQILKPLTDALARDDVTTAEILDLAATIREDTAEQGRLNEITAGASVRVFDALDFVESTLDEAGTIGEQVNTATATVVDELEFVEEEIKTTAEILSENFSKLTSPVNELIKAFEGVILTNDGYATTFSQVTEDLELTAEEATASLNELKKIREIVETLDLVQSIQGIFEDVGKDVPPGLNTVFDNLVGSLEDNIGVFDTLFGSVDETNALFDLIIQSGGFIDFQQLTDLGASLKQQTITLTNGLEVPTTAFAEMANAGFNVAGALQEFEEFTLKNKIFDITSTIINSLKTLGLTTGDRIFDAWVETQLEVANQMLSVGDNLVDIFDPANFDPNTLVELWAQALESPRFEQNNNIIVRLSSDSTTQEAAVLADQIANKLRGQGVTV